MRSYGRNIFSLIQFLCLSQRNCHFRAVFIGSDYSPLPNFFVSGTRIHGAITYVKQEIKKSVSLVTKVSPGDTNAY